MGKKYTNSHNYLSIKCLTFRNNTMRDSLIVGLCNSLTSLYAGVVVFLILGFLAKQSGGEIDQVVKGNLVRTQQVCFEIKLQKNYCSHIQDFVWNRSKTLLHFVCICLPDFLTFLWLKVIKSQKNFFSRPQILQKNNEIFYKFMP